MKNIKNLWLLQIDLNFNPQIGAHNGAFDEIVTNLQNITTSGKKVLFLIFKNVFWTEKSMY